ncbi:MAG: hypothetical protein M1838_000234 [Thelocarpon superellum]|nr:MAG: hypothetical protein M1838_000234 [Thelocarpon superellum]
MPGIWAKFRLGKSVADEALAKHAGREADPELPPTATTYRHIPVHAQTDAIIGCPGGYKEMDRVAIRRQSRRRSQMPVSYSTYRKDSYYSHTEPGSSTGLRMADRKTESRLSKRIDSGFASGMPSDRFSIGAHSVRSRHDHSGSSSQEDLPTMKGKQRAGSRPPSSVRVDSSPTGWRAPQTIRVDHLSVCEMLHDNPHRKVGQAPRLTSPREPSATTGKPAPATAGKETKGKKTWRFGRRASKAAA